MILLMLLFASMSPDSMDARTLFARANIALQQGNVQDAEKTLHALIGLERDNARYYFMLGETYQAQERLIPALRAFEKSSSLTNHSDPGTLQRMATINSWTRHYNDARTLLRKVTTLRPGNAEAMSDLADLDVRRSLHVFSSYGGWEVDNTKNSYDAGVFAGWVDWLDLYASYSRSDRLFYHRESFSVDAYIFTSYDMFIRLGYRAKRYEYSTATSPDLSAYVHVPDLQLELSYSYTPDNSVSLEAEFFSPDFFMNRSLRANNFKVSGSVRNWIIRPVYAKLFAAILRDPDPLSFIQDSPGTISSFRYETVSLVGSALGAEVGGFNAEVKYIPDRDLDNSIDWSLFTRIGYSWEHIGIQYDMLLDNYRAVGAGRTSRVHLLTLLMKPLAMLDLRVGVKSISRTITEVMPFVSVRFKTGL